MTEFIREERYIVIKRKHLSEAKEEAFRRYLFDDEIGTVECAVVESDWPEYEPVWQMIEQRVTNAPSIETGAIDQIQMPALEAWPSREEQMVVVRRDANGKPTAWCDPDIAWLVSILNDGGQPTIASCSGHGNLPPSVVLGDGRVLVVLDGLDDLHRVNKTYGATINGDPRDAEIARLREALQEAIDTFDGMMDDEINEELMPRLRAALEQKP